MDVLPAFHGFLFAEVTSLQPALSFDLITGFRYIRYHRVCNHNKLALSALCLQLKPDILQGQHQ